jgi:hypothetical protein
MSEIEPLSKEGLSQDDGVSKVRHARACPGHPRLTELKKDVDGRDEARP